MDSYYLAHYLSPTPWPPNKVPKMPFTSGLLKSEFNWGSYIAFSGYVSKTLLIQKSSLPRSLNDIE